MSESSATTSKNHTFTTPPDYLEQLLLLSVRMIKVIVSKIIEKKRTAKI